MRVCLDTLTADGSHANNLESHNKCNGPVVVAPIVQADEEPGSHTLAADTPLCSERELQEAV
jgi:hypothetical protein